jgi:hypothetical protein
MHHRMMSVDVDTNLDFDSTSSTSSSKPRSKAYNKSSSKSLAPYIPAAQEQSSSENRIRLGICAMDKKARSKPMAEILSRLDENLFQVVFFGDQVILNEPIEDWPICNVLIAFFSKGYPLEKAKEYVQLRKPFILNELEKQEILKDRRKVYDLLENSGIDVPRHLYLSRDGYVSTGTGDGNGNQDTEVHEFDDHITVNGIDIGKRPMQTGSQAYPSHTCFVCKNQGPSNNSYFFPQT